MARRENQGLHIALISLVIVTVLLLVLTYFFWSRSTHLDGQLADLKNQNSQLATEKGKAVLDAENLKKWIGYTSDIDVNEIEAQYNKDMLTYAGSLAEVQRTYKELPLHLNSKLQTVYDQLSKRAAEVRSLKDTLTSTEKQLKDELDQALAAQAKAVEDLRTVSRTAKEERDRINAERTKLARDLDKTKSESSATIAQAESKINDLDKKFNDLKVIATDRDEQIKNLTNESFETPDGLITWVNPNTQTVFVNLGGDDGIRPQVTFAVYGMDVNNLAKETPKGKIEITRVINSKMSEGRIVADDIQDPIVKGDAIYTPVWNAAGAMRFALLGKMDIDDDGRDDREYVKSLIVLNNGKIDAEDVGGELKGRLTRDTRYLIVGESIIDVTEPGEGQVARGAGGDATRIRTDMLNQASSLGVEKITLSKVLSFLRYNGEKQVIPLGRRAKAEDFKPRASRGVPRTSGTREFRDRSPSSSVRRTTAF